MKESPIKDEVHYDYILVKLAARCNIACTYCYWFRDDSVYKKPKLLTSEVEEVFIHKLRLYLSKFEIPLFEIIFHGGEPMLFGKSRFKAICVKLRQLEKELGIQLILSITTNGLLIDDEWAQIFKEFTLNVGVSVDGNEKINDTQRIDFKGKGTYSEVKRGIKVLQKHGLEPGILAVCAPNTDPSDVFQGIVEDLGIKRFDVLIPDATYLDHPPSILNYYQKLFDLWYDRYYQKDIFITIIECLVRGVLGKRSLSNSIGYTPVKTITLLTDGSLEPLDYLRISGNEFTKSPYNIFDHELQDLQNHPLWQEVYHASLNLAEKCNDCKFKYACGGGPVQSRWNTQSRYNNPSVYCEDLYGLFDYVKNRVENDLYMEKTAQ